MNLRRLIWNCRWLSDQRRIEWYPPFWLMGIKVVYISPCWREVRIRLPHSWIATNPGGSMFGGFQACLADPIAAMACVKRFPGYRVWTRSLTLDFIHQGVTDLELRFKMTRQTERAIEADLMRKNRSTPEFEYGFYLTDGRLCTRINALVAIRPVNYQKKSNQEK